jgi:hypothetical protein
MRNSTIDLEQRCCPCGALREEPGIHCQKCRARSRWNRRKAWRIKSTPDTDQATTLMKEVINR